MANFSSKVYEILKTVPKGKVTTYKEIAHALGVKSYRAVGQALKRNPYAPMVPCHRVISSDGTLGGFNGGTKDIPRIARLLEREGVPVRDGRIELEKYLHRF
ncbi:MAG: MGMT family protein [Candidatus Aenigmarchaeota archaeon]|nr:MGMT family protein [Candidatus Aenigmarchaeota archaeon]